MKDEKNMENFQEAETELEAEIEENGRPCPQPSRQCQIRKKRKNVKKYSY